jgi:hypothetical protein
MPETSRKLFFNNEPLLDYKYDCVLVAPGVDSNPLLMGFSFGLPLFCVSLFIGLFCIPAVLGKEGILLEWVCPWVIRTSNQNGGGILFCFFLLVID